MSEIFLETGFILINIFMALCMKWLYKEVEERHLFYEQKNKEPFILQLGPNKYRKINVGSHEHPIICYQLIEDEHK